MGKTVLAAGKSPRRPASIPFFFPARAARGAPAMLPGLRAEVREFRRRAGASWAATRSTAPECGYCYRVLLLFHGCAGYLLAKIWLGALLVWSLLGSPQLLSARTTPRVTRDLALERSGWGPFSVTTQSPIQTKRLPFLHETPELHPPGTLHVFTGLTLANTWIQRQGRIMIDEDVWTFAPRVEYTFNDRVAASLRWPLQFFGGGFLDGFIEGFHGAFGLGNMERERFPRNDFRAETHLVNGETFDLTGASEGDLVPRAPVVSTRIRLGEIAMDTPLTLKLSLSLPFLEDNAPIVSDDGVDWAIGFSTAHRFSSRLAATASAAFVHSRPGGLFAPNDLRTKQGSALLSLDYQFAERWAVIVQLLRESAVAKRTDTGFDLPTTEALLGVKHRFSGGSVLELAAWENLDVQDNTADLAFHAAIGTSFF